jgi:hypothetical protein
MDVDLRTAATDEAFWPTSKTSRKSMRIKVATLSNRNYSVFPLFFPCHNCNVLWHPATPPDAVLLWKSFRL